MLYVMLKDDKKDKHMSLSTDDYDKRLQEIPDKAREIDRDARRDSQE